MLNKDAPANSNFDDVLRKLHQEFIEVARDQLDDIDSMLNALEAKPALAEQYLLNIQRNIHNIKGQGATFGFPLTGRVAHMLEDYLLNTGGNLIENILDIRSYIDLMVDLISTDESIAHDDPQALLSNLPTGQKVTFSVQHIHDINVMLVMPPGLQRKVVAKELLSCGFRVIRAYDCIEALAVAIDILPKVVFINYDMVPFSGPDLCNVFAAVEKLRDVHIVLLTSHEIDDQSLQSLQGNASVVVKHKDFTEKIGELLIEWNIFDSNLNDASK